MKPAFVPGAWLRVAAAASARSSPTALLDRQRGLVAPTSASSLRHLSHGIRGGSAGCNGSCGTEAAALQASVPPAPRTAAPSIAAPAAAPAPSSNQTPAPGPSRPIVLLYDGECPLCLREVAALRARAAAFDTPPISFVDVAADDYRPEANGGVSFEEAMGRIHAVLPDGAVISGIDVFRIVYEALGLGWVYGWTQLPVLGTVAAAAYDLWAERRLSLTGRPTLQEIVAMRKKASEADSGNCDDTGCAI